MIEKINITKEELDELTRNTDRHFLPEHDETQEDDQDKKDNK